MAPPSIRQFLVDYGQFRRLKFGVVESIDLAMTRVHVARADRALAQREATQSTSRLRVVK